ncbi:hypothetical protein [Maribacter sp. LLG6340-A2]|uniref:hypothetical protein n=1 Tax=Maribacter sp. LLG6340-A2 TaxID=3160834 RepID=UPI00386F528F
MHRIFKILNIAFSFVLIISCKESKIPKNESDRIIIELYMKVLKEDQFEVFYRNTNQVYETNKNVITKVEPSSLLQKIKFVLPEQVFPDYLRIDLGSNVNQEEMLLESITIKYNSEEKKFNKDAIKKYFRPSRFIINEGFPSTLKTIKSNGKYDPLLDSNNLSGVINNLILY